MHNNHSKNSTSQPLEQLIHARLERRSLLKAAVATAPVAVVPMSLFGGEADAQPAALTFQPISLTTADTITVPDDYTWHPLLVWGDPLFHGVAPFDFNNQSAARQERSVGYNCDFLAYFALPHHASENPNHALLTVNHEYTNPEMMLPGYVGGSPTQDQVDIELAAHGLSVVEIEKQRPYNHFKAVVGSPWNRRITARTPMLITGPAAGHAYLKTSADPAGTTVLGMLNNCGGGKTPWGTLLTCEENFNQYFANAGDLPATDPRAAIHSRYGLPRAAASRRWEKFYDRFDVAKEPNEAFRFGWVVEIDPYDPTSTPKKRTALGRIKHEAATVVRARTGHAVVYSGDDERFQCMYKFVSKGVVSSKREANDGLLDDGTLYVARFYENGTGTWIPLVAGGGPLSGWTQAEVLINTRAAAAAVGGTPMDRPEDIEANPVTGKVYCAMTNNTQRGTAGRVGMDAANPRAVNRWGHIIEITEAYGDHTSTSFNWGIFMLCGDPSDGSYPTYFAGFDPSKISPIACPDNVLFDRQGNLWIATDGLPSPLPQGNDGFFAVPTQGPDRGYCRQLVSGPVGCEIAAPEFSNDDTAAFLSIQHPGEDGSYAAPLSSFPDGDKPRPTVVVITKKGKGRQAIGS